jgi:SAM-dependent methyltransferase
VTKLAAVDLADGELGDRIDFLPGDYLETDYGSNFDLVLFANVLHQETSERAAEMVRRGAEALAPDGRVVVVDFAIDDRAGNSWLDVGGRPRRGRTHRPRPRPVDHHRAETETLKR